MTDEQPQATEGGCLCTAVRFSLIGPVLGFQYCHCSRCRRFTGSAHASNLFLAPTDLAWTKGESERGTYMLDATPKFPTSFCKTCGSGLPTMSSTGNYWVVPAGSLDGDPPMYPQRHIFWGSRARWHDQAGSLPRHEELPD